ncbi:glycine betaine/L-proline ABC transporter permease/substrate-binding protein [Listeria weihenstephanensis FSL R9-0317]|uniref:Probable ergothioneine transporter EgtUBC n=1 Tax=Listeria weihenstephanensis TaxID=1006155 RepID=A0A1S7FXA7_9LIST|nr:ABC transporter permease/substrate-binding protein [Listeria weihenstephanensis]AQY52061.1 glycine/betaine ABC transporter permease [Listeria weihenstephanensis]EUJ38737.1 glycine betaine/L-proline ABC transporter permease/substrate-binding protein [Listeria weihenstephanensis FSL R9-0317]
MSKLIDTFQIRQDALWAALVQHIELSFVSLFIAVFIAVPLGIYLTNHKRAAEPIIQVTAILQTIPSLALLGLLIPLVGIGTVPAIIALVTYALLPILRNTYTGIKEIDPVLMEAAQAMGMNKWKQLYKVQLPLAMPVIMAGIRTAMVLIIGTATLAALIGAGGLGDLILLGIDRNDNSLILLGAIPAALLAILFDVILRYMEKATFKRTLITITGALVVTASIIIVPYFTQPQKEIVIAGKLGSEPEILINMYKQLIEKDTDLSVTVKPNLGKTSFVYNALKSGDVDIYPEFTGTVLETFLKEPAKSHDPEQVYEQARDGLAKTEKMAYLKPMEYNNTYAVAVSPEFAKAYNIKTISDLKAVQDSVKAGFTLEFSDRDDGYKGLQKQYGLKFDALKTMEPKLRYSALKAGDINTLDAYSTDSEIAQYKLKVLKDDKQLFPPYQGAPLMLESTLKEYPELKAPLEKLAGKITDKQMSEMNYEVNVKGKSAEEVAKNFLQKAGMLN